MTNCATKATSNHFIYGKCHTKQMKSRESCKTCLTNHTRSILCHWSLMASGTDTYIPTCEAKQFQETDVHQPEADAHLV